MKSYLPPPIFNIIKLTNGAILTFRQKKMPCFGWSPGTASFKGYG